MKKNLWLLFSIASIFLSSCGEDLPDEQDAALALPHSKELPKQEMTEAERQKLIHAKGKSVERLTFFKFQNWISSNSDDKLYVYAFWKINCAECLETMANLEALQKAYTNKLSVVFVSLDSPKILDEKIIPFVREKGLMCEVVLVEDMKTEEQKAISESWDGNVPAILLVNQPKNIRDFRPQGLDLGELQALVAPYLAL